MDTTELRKKWEVIKKNQETLHFEIKTTVDEKGAIHLSTTVDERYKKALQERLDELVIEASRVGLSLCIMESISKEDKEVYITTWKKNFEENQEIFINVLLKEGVDKFLDAVRNSAEKLKNVYPVIKLRKKWEVLKKNQEALHFEIKIKVDEKGMIHLSTTVEDQYKKALQKRLEELVLEALKIGLSLCNLQDIQEDDKTDYIHAWEQNFERDKEVFIAILLKEDVDNFLAAVMNSAEKLNLSYFMKNIYPSRMTDGTIKWSGPNNTFLEDGKWKKADDPSYQRNDPFDWDILCA